MRSLFIEERIRLQHEGESVKTILAHYDSIQELLEDLGYKFNVIKDEYWREHPDGEQIILWRWTVGRTAGVFVAECVQRGKEHLLKPLPPPEPESPTQMPLPFFI